MYFTTLQEIKDRGPCAKGYARLLKKLGKTAADREPLSFREIYEANGLYDSLWALRCLDTPDVTLFTIWCARQTARLAERPELFEALDNVENYILEGDEASLLKAKDIMYQMTGNVENIAAWKAVFFTVTGGDSAPMLVAEEARRAVGKAWCTMLELQSGMFLSKFCRE